MKKRRTAILIVDIILGLLLFCSYGYKRGIGAAIRAESKTVAIGREASDTVADIEQSDMGTVDGIADAEKIADADSMKKIAITFDDGPHPHYTEQLLEGLKERGIHATFFVTGEHAKLHPDIIKRMQEEGHLIGNHTYSHMQLKKSNKEEFKEELILTNEVISRITGEETQYVRPPYGSWDKSFEAELNMFPVLWTIDPLDWCSQNVSCITRKVVENAEENDIILMHDYYETTVTAALQIIDELTAEGYTFVTVEEILFD